MVLIANEVVEEYRAKKKEGVVFKIDFEKAYDHISWEFLDFVLERKGFGNKWRSWIKGCISSANFSVVINGRPRGHFGASRRIRQGDPLSPFLLILVADVLSRLMKKACESSLIKGFEVGRNKVRISHLQFADDSIFFVSNRDNCIKNLVGVIKLFSLVLGFKVDMGKSSHIAHELGCDSGSWPFTYLGLPLGGNPSSLSFWDPVIERIAKRVEGWHKGCLSRGGRLVLLQSVLGSIPIYFLPLFKIPNKAVSILEKIMRDFFWEGKLRVKGVI